MPLAQHTRAPHVPPGSDVERLPASLAAPPRRALAVKRLLDATVASVGLLILSPAFVVVGILIKCDSRGPVFFRQLRMGRRGRTFRLVKFRTMVADADERKGELAHLNKHAQNGSDGRMFKVPDDPRVTRVGAVLRRHFLDELPQLINVIRGEMSLVGPRPLILDEDRHVEGLARCRLDFRPGMTGLWQVLGHNEIPFRQMVDLDIKYVTTWSFRNDLRLLLRTLPVVLHGDRGRH